MSECLSPDELSVLPSALSWTGRAQVTLVAEGRDVPATPLTCPWPPGRWGPGKWFSSQSALAGAAGKIKILLGINTVVVQPAPMYNRGCAGKAQPHRAAPHSWGRAGELKQFPNRSWVVMLAQ